MVIDAENRLDRTCEKAVEKRVAVREQINLPVFRSAKVQKPSALLRGRLQERCSTTLRLGKQDFF